MNLISKKMSTISCLVLAIKQLRRYEEIKKKRLHCDQPLSRSVHVLYLMHNRGHTESVLRLYIVSKKRRGRALNLMIVIIFTDIFVV